MKTFNEWYNNADIPTQDSEGNWYDAETGFTYKDFVASQKPKATRKKVDAKTQASRNVAKMYGGKALKGGSAKQKKWAEEIRKNVLESKYLSDEDKIELMKCSDIVTDAKFWISNKDKPASAFKAKKILEENALIKELYNKHYETLTRSSLKYEIESAKEEIYEALKALTINVKYDFPRCDFYDVFGNLK